MHVMVFEYSLTNTLQCGCSGVGVLPNPSPPIDLNSFSLFISLFSSLFYMDIDTTNKRV